MKILLTVILGIFILGILVLIHELGHFLVAKYFRIRVLSFSIGFGRVLFKKVYRETEYRISAIPFGGYVHMAGEHPEDEREHRDDEFLSKPVWQRVCVVSAGPAANIISSILFLWLAFSLGINRELYYDRPVIGDVTINSPAHKAGLLPGDSIISLNEKTVHTWEDILQLLSFQESRYLISYVRQHALHTTILEIPKQNTSGLPKYPSAGLAPCLPPKIGLVNQGSAAEKAGVKPGDSILAIDNQTIYSWFQISRLIAGYQSVYGPMQLIVKRNDSTLILCPEPEFSTKENRYLLGILVAQPPTRIVKYSLAAAIPKALDKSWEYTTMIFDILGKLISNEVSPKQLAGPVGIIQMSGVVALGSFVALLNFMALIGINLGVLNLFPLIITDGGVLLFLLYESIRGKPLSLKAQAAFNRAAIFFFIMLFVYVTFNDIMRIPELLRMGR